MPTKASMIVLSPTTTRPSNSSRTYVMSTTTVDKLMKTMHDSDRAIADYNLAIQLKPDFAEAYDKRGNAYADKGENDRAIADYNQAIQLKSDNAFAYNDRGLAYDNRGDQSTCHC